MISSRRSLIKGIGAAICAGMTPSFVKAALPEDVLTISGGTVGMGIANPTTQLNVKDTIARANWENANRHRFWDNADSDGNIVPGMEDLDTTLASKGYGRIYDLQLPASRELIVRREQLVSVYEQKKQLIKSAWRK